MPLECPNRDRISVQQTCKPANKKASNHASQQASKPDKEVNLCARVPESHRRWWAGQSKMAGKSMTQVIKDALITEFGLPPD